MSTPMTMKTIVFSSLFFAAQVLAQAQEKPPNTGYNGGEDNPQDPDDAGSEGASKGAFSISKGGLAAIIVVAVLVVIGGGTTPYSPTQVYPVLRKGQIIACL